MPKIMDLLRSKVDFGWFQCQTCCLKCSNYILQQPEVSFPRCRTRDDIVHIYQQATPLAKIGERKRRDTLEYLRCIGDAKGEGFEDVFAF